MPDQLLQPSINPPTRRSLLVRAGSGDEGAWKLLSDAYRPFIQSWLARHQVPFADAEDLAQNVMMSVFQHLKTFEHSGRPGAFRCWLRTMTINQMLDYRKSSQRRFLTTDFQQADDVANNLRCSQEDLEAEWNSEHEQFVLRSVLTLVEMEFEFSTIAAFHGICIEGRSAPQVAESLGVSVGAVYTAKSRVLQRIRRAIEELDLFID